MYLYDNKVVCVQKRTSFRDDVCCVIRDKITIFFLLFIFYFVLVFLFWLPKQFRGLEFFCLFSFGCVRYFVFSRSLKFLNGLADVILILLDNAP